MDSHWCTKSTVRLINYPTLDIESSFVCCVFCRSTVYSSAKSSALHVSFVGPYLINVEWDVLQSNDQLPLQPVNS